MITNDAELEVVRKQLARVDAALDDLRRKMLPDNERMFKVFAEAPTELRSSLQADIDCYLNISKPAPKDVPTVHESTQARLLELT